MFDEDHDAQAELVYLAEDLVEESTRGQRFRRLEEIDDWLRDILESRWFWTRFPRVKGIALHDGRGCWRALGWRDANGVCHLSLPRGARFPLIVLHELAHGLEHDLHDREFCSTYLSLVWRFLGREPFRDLRQQFAVCRVIHRRPRQPPTWSVDGIMCEF
jgi:putative metallohydrolase (TIGR04338 family)